MRRFALISLFVAAAGLALAGARIEKQTIVQDIDSASSITVTQDTGAGISGRIARLWCTAPALTGTAATYTLALTTPDSLSLVSVTGSESATLAHDYATTGVWFAGPTTITITESEGQTTSPTFTLWMLYEN